MEEMGIKPSRKIFVTKLIDWGRKNRRDFPWRKESDAFRILIAEVLLQRSRANTVAPVYAQLFEQWPDSATLASVAISELQDVIRPLGLTHRAKTVITLARAIEERGGVPDTTEELMSLPGVGRYIASATASAAFGSHEPLVDGVSNRVYDRFFGLSSSTNSQHVASNRDKGIWRFVEGLTSKGEMTELNWAALDLAATVCMPRKPRHHSCPLNRWCAYVRSERECGL